VLQRAQAAVNRLQKLQLKDQAEMVTAAYRMVFGRDPSETEKQAAVSFLSEQSKCIAGSEQKLAQVDVEPMMGRPGMAALFKPAGRQTRLQVPDNHLMPQYDFAIEAFVVLHSSDKAGALRTIASRWDGRPNQPGWSFGVARKPPDDSSQGLVLELVGDP